MLELKHPAESSGWFLWNKTAKILFFIPVFAVTILNSQAQEKADTTIRIGEVTVSAYRVSGEVHTTPGSISVLSGNLTAASAGNNLATVINTIPGITMQSGTFATNRIVIRGMGSRTPYNSNRIRAYLNDIPLTESDGVSTPEEINLQDLGRIEVVKGPSSAFYGSGLGGSINMYTPGDTSNTGNISVQYGSFKTGKALASGTMKAGNALLWGSLSHMNSEGYRENSNYRRTTLLTTSRIEQPGWSISTLLLLMNVKGGIPSSVGRTQFDNAPWEAAPNWLAIGGYQEYTRGIAAISLKSSLTNNLTGEGTLFGRYNNNFERRPFNDLDDQTISTGLRYKLTLEKGLSEIAAGTEWITEQYGWEIITSGTLTNRNNEIRKLFNVFAVWDYKPVTGLNISAAGALNFVNYRLIDQFSANGDQSGTRSFPAIFSPRIGLNYATGPRFAAYASAGHGFSLPSPEETLLPEGDVNPGIKPEQGMQYETGVRINSPSRNIEIDASVYWIELNNLLVTKRVTEDIFTGINAGKTRHQGIELMLRTRYFYFESFPGRLSSVLSYTRSFNRFIEFTDNEVNYDGNHLPGIPEESIQFQVSWQPVETAALDIHLQYYGDQYLTDNNSLEYPGYFLADSRVKYTFDINRSSLEISAGINNLTGTRYASMLLINAIGFGNTQPRYYYPGLPRNWFAGIRLIF
jgi:iron complex outermembrane recepter protein